MNIFIDTNILIDVIGKREDFFENAQKILKLGEEGTINLFISPLSLVNSLYILKRTYKIDEERVKTILKQITTFIKVTDMTGKNVDDALNSNFKDFEDALQNFSAENNTIISVIITRNPQDFSSSSLLVQTPKEFLDTNNFNEKNS
ncbi:type II toxin-antitoxin system VapC family toxin [Bernardetia sp.]|uniref:type II toxin-antitoxin system VapC family toxin n=1 Tax=Bernardetia sp. TaxID=1937974 RepID=UPI0025C63A4C|nr:PIN domain-containing protein [Bernardetia sp.]